MSTWGQAPEQAEPPARAFRARSGDTVPGFVLSGAGGGPNASPETGWPPGNWHPASRPRRGRVRTLLRRSLATLVVVVVLGAAAFGGLLLVTPSAGQAQSLAWTQAQAHGVAYPGPAVPARFAAALVATEDHRFYQDPGIDPIAVGRVALGYLRGHGPEQGGATITQQLAKMLYTPANSSLKAEAEQIALAVKLDVTYSKAQILRMYAAVVYFGQGYYGLGTASCGYFGVPPAALSWPQAAVLAGLVQAPTAYDPLTNPAQARAREAHVLGRLSATGKLTRAQASTALAESLDLVAPGQALAEPPPGSASCGGLRG